MKNIIFVGGGGFALEIYSFMQDDKNFKNTICGVIDDSVGCELIKRYPEIEYLGKIKQYKFKINEKAIITIGDPFLRKDIFNFLKQKNIEFLSYIHSTAFVASDSKMGEGCYVGPHCIISSKSEIKDNISLNVYCGVGHGAKVESHVVVSPYSVINGDCQVGDAVFLGSRVTLFPKIRIGKGSSIDSGVILRHDVDNFKMVSQRVAEKVFSDRIKEQKWKHI